MTEQSQFLLNQAIVSIKAGDLEGGRKLLEGVLEIEPNNESAWMWMSAAVTSDDERRRCLEEVLQINPDNQQARRGLEKLGPASPPSPAAFGSDEPGTPPAFTWALEPDQRDLAPEPLSDEVDLEALFKSFDEASAPGDSDLKEIEWGFDEPLGTDQSSAAQGLSGEESLDRFLGVQTPGDEVRGFYEQDAQQGKAVPAFTFDEEPETGAAIAGAAALAGTSEAFVSPPLPDTDFSFDIDQITSESAPETPKTVASGLLKLWAVSGVKTNGVVILRDEYLILANPDPLFIDKIREEVAQGEVKKKSLGRTAKAITLKSVQRVQGEPQGNSFEVTYLKGKQKNKETAEFASLLERDEALDALAGQLGLGFRKTEETRSRLQLILLPLAAMVIACLLTPLLGFLVTLLTGTANNLMGVSLGLILSVCTGIAGFLTFIGGLVLLIAKLRQPLKLVAIVPADEMDARMTTG
jgi:hypothetical protein